MQELGSHTSRFHSLHSLVSSLENLGEPRVRVCVCVCARRSRGAVGLARVGVVAALGAPRRQNSVGRS